MPHRLPQLVASGACALPPAQIPTIRNYAISHALMCLRASGAAQESRNMLEAFFIGRALAETLNERAGSALGDALANFGTLDAEFRQGLR